MTETQHTTAASLHNRLLDGDLDPEGERRLAEHRARCPACDASFAGIERLVHALQGLERFEPRPDFADRILERVRPAPLPFWARWKLTPVWGRAAALALLFAAGLGFVGALPLLDLLLDIDGPAVLFRGPRLLADALVALADRLDPFRSVAELAAVFIRVLLTVAATPAFVAALIGSALLSASAFLQLSRMLVPPQTRRSFHA